MFAATARGLTLFQSPAYLIAGATPTLWARIASKTERAESFQCWRWTGAVSIKRDGAARPVIQVGGRGSLVAIVARVLLTQYDGIPLVERAGLEAGHLCHHHWCVNPSHLEWQTRQENEDAKSEYDDALDAVA